MDALQSTVMSWLQSQLSPAWALFWMFVTGFVGATILPLPLGSEAILLWVTQQLPAWTWAAVAVGTLGNALGSLSNCWLGLWLRQRPSGERAEAWLEKHLDPRAVRWLEKHGAPLLFFSWVPVIGDPCCVAAGWLRVPIAQATVWIVLGKLFRYSALVLGARYWVG